VWSRLLDSSQATYSTQCTQLASRLSNITTATTGQKTIGSENAVWPPHDGRKDASNMLRNNWLPIKSLIVASSWSHFYLRHNWSLGHDHVAILPVIMRVELHLTLCKLRSCECVVQGIKIPTAQAWLWNLWCYRVVWVSLQQPQQR